MCANSHVNREFAAKSGESLKSASFVMPGRGNRVNSTAKTIIFIVYSYIVF